MIFFVNAIILSANVLKAHELVQDNQDLIKDIILRILEQSDSENSTSQAERANAPHSREPRADETKPHAPHPHARSQHHTTPSPSRKERL